MNQKDSCGQDLFIDQTGEYDQIDYKNIINSMTISEIRLKNTEKVIDRFFNGNKSSLAKAIGKFPTYISKWWTENETTRRNIGSTTARLIENAVGLEKGWLDIQHDQIGDQGANYSASPALPKIPVSGTAQLGDDGHWDFIEPNHADGFIILPSTDPNAYSLRLKGDSMRPAIKSGWYAVCEPKHDLVLGEYVHVTTNDGRSMVKELLILNDNQIVLESVNEDHKRITLDPAEIGTMHYAFIVPPSKHSL